MYYLSPFTYLASAMLSTGVANTNATCLDYELLHFTPQGGQTCGGYMDAFVKMAGGYVANPGATSDCAFCTISDTNVFLKAVSANYSDRWRNFGILWAYVIFNIAAALFFYWLGRVPGKSKGPREEATVATAEKGEDDGLAEAGYKDATPETEAEVQKEGKNDAAESQEEGEKK
jgi:ATP-binding cassette, subfamily G (WHITE), member 2, PDR